VPSIAGPTLVSPMLPMRPVNGSLTAEPRGRLFAGSGSLLDGPLPQKAVDTGAKRDSSAQPAKMIMGRMASMLRRMIWSPLLSSAALMRHGSEKALAAGLRPAVALHVTARGW